MGGMFFLFIPGIFIVIYLSMAAFELIIGNKKVIPAMVGSYQIILQHFGSIFLRYLALFLPYFLVFGILPEILSESDSVAASIFNLVLIIAGNLFSIFTVAYTVELYKEASNKTDYSKTVSLVWMWIVAILGWIIISLGGYLVVKYVLPEAKSAITQEFSQKKETEQPNLAYTSSGCGLSIPVPSTTDTYKTKERKWIFEELPMDKNSFYMLDNDVYPHSIVLGSFLGYKETDKRLGGKSFTVGYPGINVFCIDNTKELTFNEFISAVQTSKGIQAETKGNVSFDGLDFQLVQFNGTDENEREFTDSVYLGVSNDGSRLIAIRVWNAAGSEEYQEIESTLDTDLSTILDNIKSRDISSKVIDLAKPQL